MSSPLKWSLALQAVLFALVVSVNASAQESKTESWLGTLDVGAAKLRIQLNLTEGNDGKYSGEMISLDQTPDGIKMDKVVRTDKKLEFAIKRLGASFAGKLNDDQTVATGKFTQGQKFEMVFKRMEGEVKPDKHIQSWKGTMDAGGKEFEFQFRVFEDSQGEKLVKLDSFSESATSIPADYEKNGDEITITVPMTKAKFVGTLSDDEKTIDGNWLQAGGKFPLKLTSVPIEESRELKLNRPQTPKAPFNYDASDFSVVVNSIDSKFPAGVEIAGTMTSPKGAGPFPTVILISGSGPQDRDETIFEHKPFLVLADHLTKKGFVVIRFDERGVGESKGDFGTATTADFADDVEALVAWAKKQSKVDGKKIVLAGHSEGGLVAPMVASKIPDIAGIILLAGPGVSGSEIVMNQTRKIAAAAGAPERILEMQDKMLAKMMAHVESGDPVTDEFKKSLEDEFKDLSDEERAEFGADGVAEKTIAMMGSPWMSYFLTYDPSEALTKTSCPILSVIGGKDLQVDSGLNFPAIEAAVKAGKNPDFTQKKLPGLNHLFQKSETGSPSEYVQIEETMDASLLDAVTLWLEKRFK